MEIRLRKRNLRLAAAAVCGALLFCYGCSEQKPQSRYQALRGTVRALDVETGEVFVRAEGPLAGWRSDRDVPCVITRDSEIYINDRFSQVQDVWVADTVELVGYRDKDHLAVALMTITRNQPEPEPPPLSAPTTRPGAAKPEE